MTRQNEKHHTVDRRTLVRSSGAALAATGLIAAAAGNPSPLRAAFVPNNFRAAIHLTRQQDFPYAFSSLDTIAQHYRKATGRLIVDGDAVTGLTDEAILAQIDAAHKAGAEIFAASDALAINGLDPSALPEYVDASATGIIAVVDAQVKGYHYVKL